MTRSAVSTATSPSSRVVRGRERVVHVRINQSGWLGRRPPASPAERKDRTRVLHRSRGLACRRCGHLDDPLISGEANADRLNSSRPVSTITGKSCRTSPGRVSTTGPCSASTDSSLASGRALRDRDRGQRSFRMDSSSVPSFQVPRRGGKVMLPRASANTGRKDVGASTD